MKRRFTKRVCGFALASTVPVLAVWACGAPRVPPGPEPEYQRPTVMPWDAGVPEDPLAAIEDDGEWVDDEPAGANASDAGANASDAGVALPADGGDAAAPSPEEERSTPPDANGPEPPKGSSPPPDAAPPPSPKPSSVPSAERPVGPQPIPVPRGSRRGPLPP